ncbi:uncharacterized protein B0H18DRAFT_1018446 [Fomitopsis serialis]|uniref:uncharacterized protein n=1 Tax=Fomitopsis serialis TaxID=139415 RepID=UPI002007C252|nr:uncharacterized protein B0H18DRAFT_1018446 [Neoantrodia serialis]KAH9922193.1 hypothetical protein B0H18DRAFT_1018446 [Neoantrodia serialis]
MDHPLCEICKGQLFQAHNDAPKPTYSKGCGHLFCNDCIAVYIIQNPHSGCPACAAPLEGRAAYLPASVRSGTSRPISLINQIYVTTEADDSDARIVGEVAQNSSLLQKQHELDSMNHRVQMLKRAHDALKNEHASNTSIIDSLMHQLEAAGDVRREAEGFRSTQRRELGQLRSERQDLEDILDAIRLGDRPRR